MYYLFILIFKFFEHSYKLSAKGAKQLCHKFSHIHSFDCD